MDRNKAAFSNFLAYCGRGLSHWIRMTLSPRMSEERGRLPEEDQSQKLQHKPALGRGGEIWDAIA